MKKVKTKKQKKMMAPAAKAKVVKRASRKKAKKYPAYVLGIALVLVMLAETAVMFNATTTDWKNGLAVLDVSQGVTEIAQTVNFSAQPIVAAVTGSNQFYRQSAVATIELLNPKEDDGMMFIDGVNNFYAQASDQMAQVLDISNYFSPTQQPKVAGATIYKY